MAVRPATLLSLCAGYGGLELGVRLALPRIRCVGAVERQAFAAAVLASRMVEGALDPCPIHDDLESFDGRAYRDRVDLVVAGFPCQGASVAGKRLGVVDERWLWPQVWRVTQETNARWFFGENVPGLLSVNGGGAFEDILRDLASRGWDAEWDCVPAAAVGAPHLRDRVFLLATDASRVGVRVEPERDQRRGRRARAAERGAAESRDRRTHRDDPDTASIGRDEGRSVGADKGRARGRHAGGSGEHGDATDAGRAGPQGRRKGRATSDATPDSDDATQQPPERSQAPQRGRSRADAPDRGQDATSDPDRRGCEGKRRGREPDPGQRAAQWSDADGRGGPRDRHPDLARIHDLGRVHWEWSNAPEPCIRGMDDGASGWLGDDQAYAETLHLLGNGVVPHAAAAAFLTLFERLHPTFTGDPAA